MLTYRIYWLERDHVIGPPMVIECPDDQAAIEAAKVMLDGKAIEVWEAARVVIRLEPKRQGA
jgi:hypothetical protein